MISVFTLQAMEYRIADERDHDQILNLINEHAVKDYKKIVIVPKLFRPDFVRGNIAARRLFVASSDKGIVGYKKLYLMSDHAERESVLKDELRCMGANPVYKGFVDESGSVSLDDTVTPDDYGVCIYDGGDYTLPAYRGRGINTALTNASLDSFRPDVTAALTASAAKMLTLVYGITQANAGEKPGATGDRTRSISRSFMHLIKSLEHRSDPIVLKHFRYTAFMPTFDSESTECVPLPDDQSVPGYGCVLSYKMKDLRE